MGNHGNYPKNEKINKKDEIKQNNNKLKLIKDSIEIKQIQNKLEIRYLFKLKDNRIILADALYINIYDEELLKIDLKFENPGRGLKKITQLKDDRVLFVYGFCISILQINQNSFFLSQYINIIQPIDIFQIDYDDLYIGTLNNIIKYQKDEKLFKITDSFKIENYKYSYIWYTDNSLITFPDLNSNNIIFLELDSRFEKIGYYGKKIYPESKICKIENSFIFINYTTFSLIDIDNQQIQTTINSLYVFYSICILDQNYIAFGGEDRIFVYEKGIDEWKYKEERNIFDNFNVNTDLNVTFIIKTNSGKIIFTDNKCRIRILQ